MPQTPHTRSRAAGPCARRICATANRGRASGFQADEAECQPYAERASQAAYSQEGWNSFGRSLLAEGLGAAMGSSAGSGFGMAGYGSRVRATYGLAAGTGHG